MWWHIFSILAKNIYTIAQQTHVLIPTSVLLRLGKPLFNICAVIKWTTAWINSLVLPQVGLEKFVPRWSS